jgi:hypothetical protein
MLVGILIGFVIPVCLFLFWAGALFLINKACDNSTLENFKDDL